MTAWSLFAATALPKAFALWLLAPFCTCLDLELYFLKTFETLGPCTFYLAELFVTEYNNLFGFLYFLLAASLGLFALLVSQWLTMRRAAAHGIECLHGVETRPNGATSRRR